MVALVHAGLRRGARPFVERRRLYVRRALTAYWTGRRSCPSDTSRAAQRPQCGGDCFAVPHGDTNNPSTSDMNNKTLFLLAALSFSVNLATGCTVTDDDEPHTENRQDAGSKPRPSTGEGPGRPRPGGPDAGDVSNHDAGDPDESQSPSTPAPSADGADAGSGSPNVDPNGPASSPPPTTGAESDAGGGSAAPGEPAEPGPVEGGEEQPTPGEPQVSYRFMPTPEPVNTRAPKLVVDGSGGLHAIYPAYAGGDAYYAYCPDGCGDENALGVVELPADGTVVNAMLAVTPDGAPRVLLSTMLEVTWAQCDADCTDAANWRSEVIVEHGGDLEVSGNALALDDNGRPRFIAHTYLALLGIGQKPPQTFLFQCDDDCSDPGSWRMDSIADQIWQMSQLRYDAGGRAHLATVVVDVDSGGPTGRLAAYLECEAGCESDAGWQGIGLMSAFENDAQQIQPAIAMALTEGGGPRVALLGALDGGARGLVYFECDDDCVEDNWGAALISDQDQLGAGVDVVVDALGRPRVAFTLADNIGVYLCDDQPCTSETATWDLSKVEFASDLPQDDVILWPNCTLDAWVLHQPSLVIDDGFAFVGYQATDLSGGLQTTDPTKPPCLAGPDMTLARLAHLVAD